MKPAAPMWRMGRWCLVAGALSLACSLPAWAQIKIGQPSGFTGAVAAGVKENTDGARLYIDHVNARGGVGGQKIELISVDDQFNPKRTLELATELIDRHNVVALFLNRGTPHSQGLLPLLTERKVPCMDAPGLPSCQFTTVRRYRLQPCIRTLCVGRAYGP